MTPLRGRRVTMNERHRRVQRKWVVLVLRRLGGQTALQFLESQFQRFARDLALGAARLRLGKVILPGQVPVPQLAGVEIEGRKQGPILSRADRRVCGCCCNSSRTMVLYCIGVLLRDERNGCLAAPGILPGSVENSSNGCRHRRGAFGVIYRNDG